MPGRNGSWRFRLVAWIVEPLLVLLTRRRWSGQHHIPRDGGVILAANHISLVDPLTLAHFVYRSGRQVHFLAKSELFRQPVLGRVLLALGQIPVYRHTADAATALQDAEAALRRGDCVVVYPEGTVTRDPNYWPMRGRTGLLRLALATGVPVIPVAQWGAQEILGRDGRFRPFPRRTAWVTAGPPVDLSAYGGDADSTEVLRQGTDAVLGVVRRLLGGIRGEQPPTAFFDPMAASRAGPPTADPDRRPA